MEREGISINFILFSKLHGVTLDEVITEYQQFWVHVNSMHFCVEVQCLYLCNTHTRIHRQTHSVA